MNEQYMRKKRIGFEPESIDRVVLAIVSTSFHHECTNRYESVRRMARVLTTEMPQKGSTANEVDSLIKQCKACNASLSQVMGVIWERIENAKMTSWWKPVLLGLHLLKRLLLHGVSLICIQVASLHDHLSNLVTPFL